MYIYIYIYIYIYFFFFFTPFRYFSVLKKTLKPKEFTFNQFLMGNRGLSLVINMKYNDFVVLDCCQ